MDSRLTLTQYRVLGALLSFRGRDTSVIWPSREALSARTGLAVAKISYATTALCRLGWLTKEGCGGRSRSCHYRITVPADLTNMAESALNNENNTVPDSGTVSKNTVPDSGTVNSLNGTRFGYETVPESGRGIEETKKIPETKEEANASMSKPSAPVIDRCQVVDLFGDKIEEKPAIPPCPHKEIVDLYHEILPELPGIVFSLWPNSKDAQALALIWKADKRHRDMEFWQRFFEAVRTSAHWMGENGKWKANLRWLVAKSHFIAGVELMANNKRRGHAHG